MHPNLRTALILPLVFAGLLSAADIRVSTADALKAAIKRTTPEYPSVARQLRIIGTVAIDVTVDAEGNVGDVKVLSGNALLTAAAAAAAKKWKFTPFTQDGMPVTAIAEIAFEFKL